MRLVLTIGGNALSFTRLNDDGPYPYLNSVSDIRIAARAGSATFASNETPSGSVSLDNVDGKVSGLIGNPLRARADIYDGDALAFSGFVSSVNYGLEVVLNLES